MLGFSVQGGGGGGGAHGGFDPEDKIANLRASAKQAALVRLWSALSEGF